MRAWHLYSILLIPLVHSFTLSHTPAVAYAVQEPPRLSTASAQVIEVTRGASGIVRVGELRGSSREPNGFAGRMGERPNRDQRPKRWADRAFAFSASSARFFLGAVVSSDCKEARRHARDFVNGSVERGFVAFGRLVEATDLANELKGRGSDFVLGDGWIEIEQRLDISAHD